MTGEDRFESQAREFRDDVFVIVFCGDSAAVSARPPYLFEAIAADDFA